jgi:ribosome-binding factor A
MFNKENYSQRQLRASELIKSSLIEVLKKGKTLDIRLFEAKITVSEVEISPDLKVATCFVLNFPGSKLSSDELIKALSACKGMLRNMVNSKIQMKFSPELRFKYDHSFDLVDQIEKSMVS